MIKHAAALLLIVPLLTCSAKSDVVIITPLNTYTEKDIIIKAEAYCRQYGMLPAEIRADTEAWKHLINEVIREYINEDLSRIHTERISSAGEAEVTEDEIRERYETLLRSQKQYFAGKREIVSSAIKFPREIIVYYPKGLKYVRFFTIPFESEIRGRAAILLSENKIGDFERLVEEAERNMSPLLGEVRQRLRNGYNFDKLAEEYDGISEDLLYTEDPSLFPGQLRALETLNHPGDIAEYNIYQGHVFMIFDREPEYSEVPYEQIREEIAMSILKTKTIIQHDRLMKELYEKAIADGSVKIRNTTNL